MVIRVNFIEKSAFTLTYRNMIIFAVGMAIICLLIQGIFVFRVMLVKSSLGESKRQIQELSIKKEKALLALQIAQTQNVATTASLASLFVKMPLWSAVFSEIAENLPDQLWFTNLRSSNIGDKAGVRRLEISGLSTSHAAIAQFAKLLEDSDRFSNTLLVNTHKEKDGGKYNFIVNTDVTFPDSEW